MSPNTHQVIYIYPCISLPLPCVSVPQQLGPRDMDTIQHSICLPAHNYHCFKIQYFTRVELWVHSQAPAGVQTWSCDTLTAGVILAGREKHRAAPSASIDLGSFQGAKRKAAVAPALLSPPCCCSFRQCACSRSPPRKPCWPALNKHHAPSRNPAGTSSYSNSPSTCSASLEALEKLPTAFFSIALPPLEGDFALLRFTSVAFLTAWLLFVTQSKHTSLFPFTPAWIKRKHDDFLSGSLKLHDFCANTSQLPPAAWLQA